MAPRPFNPCVVCGSRGVQINANKWVCERHCQKTASPEQCPNCTSPMDAVLVLQNVFYFECRKAACGFVVKKNFDGGTTIDRGISPSWQHQYVDTRDNETWQRANFEREEAERAERARLAVLAQQAKAEREERERQARLAQQQRDEERRMAQQQRDEERRMAQRAAEAENLRRRLAELEKSIPTFSQELTIVEPATRKIELE